MARVGRAFTLPDSDDQRAPQSLPVVLHVARARSLPAHTNSCGRRERQSGSDRCQRVVRSRPHGARDAPVSARVEQLVGNADGRVPDCANSRLSPSTQHRSAARTASLEFASLRLADARPRGPHHFARDATRALRDAREFRAPTRRRSVSRRLAAEPRRSRMLLYSGNSFMTGSCTVLSCSICSLHAYLHFILLESSRVPYIIRLLCNQSINILMI